MEPNETHRDLRALFEDGHDVIADEPFVSAIARRIAAEQRQRTVLRRALLAAALVVVVGFSPWLVAASVTMSARLEILFDSASMFLATRYGLALAVLCAGAVVYVNRKLIF
jgi:hypothetical protein